MVGSALLMVSVSACGNGGSSAASANETNVAACAAMRRFDNYWYQATLHYSGQSVAQEEAADMPHIRALERAVRGASNAIVRRSGLEIAALYLYYYGQHPSPAAGKVPIVGNLHGLSKTFEEACRHIGFRGQSKSATVAAKSSMPAPRRTASSAAPATTSSTSGPSTTSGTVPDTTGPPPTAPTLPPVTAPHAPWDTVVAASGRLRQVVQAWLAEATFSGPNPYAGCPLYLPTRPSLFTKTAPLISWGGSSGVQQFTVLFAGATFVVWPPFEAEIVATQFPNKPTLTFSDGSVERDSPNGDFDVLLAIPGSPCYYELLAPDHADFANDFMSLRLISGAQMPIQ